jgi:YjbE family integral membrane protein
LEGLILVIKMVVVNLVLSGDNAVVIAMASKNLPEVQRTKAIWWGAVGAVILRVLLSAVAVFLLQIPLIQLCGSLLLLYVAVKLLRDDEQQEHSAIGAGLGSVIFTIVMADVVMSLDNVLAIAAIAGGSLVLLCIGILISIPLIIWGSAYITNLLHRFPALIYIGAGILGFTAGEMFLKDAKVQDWFDVTHVMLHWGVPIISALGVVIAGRLMRNKSISDN